MRSLKTLIVLSVIGTGVTTVPVQLISIREFLSQFQGNEITISLVLSCWLLLTGLGSLLAKFLKRPGPGFYGVLCVILGVWPLLQLLVIRYGREFFFIHGSAPGFYGILWYILATTAPYCLMAGFILPCALEVLRRQGEAFSAGGLYITDSIGDIIGGSLFGFVLVYWLKPFPSLVLTSSLVLLTGVVILVACKRPYLAGFAILLIVPFVLMGVNKGFEINSLEGQYGSIVRYLESPYGRVMVTEKGGAHTFWESGAPLQAGENTAVMEEKVHYPLSQRKNAGNVLLVSGGIGGTLEEVLKHRPASIDYVELDPYLTQAAVELGLLDPYGRVSVINMDGRRYINTTEKVYDAIILDLPDPDTFQMNRFFTAEFFSIALKRLTPNGVLCLGLDYYPNYISDVMGDKLSSIYNTLKMFFSSALVIPGEKAYFLCSNGPLTLLIPQRLEEKHISTNFISAYFRGNVTQDRLDMIREILDPKTPINTDFQPKIMSLVFHEWFLKHGSSPRPFFLALGAITLVYLLLIRKEEYVLFTTGFATMGAEMLVVFAFQVLYGYVYLKIGAIVTAFLAGLLPGAAVGKFLGRHRIGKFLMADILLVLGLVGFYAWLRLHGQAANQIWFLAYGFLFSFLCGFQFPAATEIIGEDKGPAAGCLAADMMGAAIGTLVVGTVLIPLLGLQAATIALILIKVSSNFAILFSGSAGAET